MSLDNFKTIDIDLTNANEAIPPIRLNAGDIDGRKITVRLYDGAASVGETDVKSAELAWNQDIANPASAGGYVAMSKGTSGGTVAFTATIPRELLLDPATNDRVCTLGVILHDAAGTTVTRNITAIIEPSVLNASAPDILDPLKELHNAANTATTAAKQAQQAVEAANSAVERVNDVMDGAEAQANNAKASADAAAQSATAAQSAAQQASTAVAHASEYAQAALERSDSASTFARSAQSAAQQALMAQNQAFEAVNGFGIRSLSVDYTQHPNDTPTAEVDKVKDSPGQYTVALHLSHPQTISQIAVTTLEPDAQATADFDTDADGNLIVNLGIPKGRPGEGGSIATADVAGAVRPGPGMIVNEDGTLALRTSTGLTIMDGNWLAVKTSGDSPIYDNGDALALRLGDGLCMAVPDTPQVGGETEMNLSVFLGTGLSAGDTGEINVLINTCIGVSFDGFDEVANVKMPATFTPETILGNNSIKLGLIKWPGFISYDKLDAGQRITFQFSTMLGVEVEAGFVATISIEGLNDGSYKTFDATIVDGVKATDREITVETVKEIPLDGSIFKAGNTISSIAYLRADYPARMLQQVQRLAQVAGFDLPDKIREQLAEQPQLLVPTPALLTANQLADKAKTETSKEAE